MHPMSSVNAGFTLRDRAPSGGTMRRTLALRSSSRTPRRRHWRQAEEQNQTGRKEDDQHAKPRNSKEPKRPVGLGVGGIRSRFATTSWQVRRGCLQNDTNGGEDESRPEPAIGGKPQPVFLLPIRAALLGSEDRDAQCGLTHHSGLLMVREQGGHETNQEQQRTNQVRDVTDSHAGSFRDVGWLSCPLPSVRHAAGQRPRSPAGASKASLGLVPAELGAHRRR